MGKRPSTNGGNGARDEGGRFANGNPGGPGNPYAQQVARIRSAILEAVSDDDLRAVVAALVEKARKGDVAAARELLNRLAGKPHAGTWPEDLQLEHERLKLDERHATVAEQNALTASCRF